LAAMCSRSPDIYRATGQKSPAPSIRIRTRSKSCVEFQFQPSTDRNRRDSRSRPEG
jgi:hypothetical protein